jgi:hypothetical protein
MSFLLLFTRVYRLEIRSVMLLFSTQLCELLPLYPFFFVHLHPLPKVKVEYVQTMCDWEGVGGGVWGCVGDHILQEFNTL